MPAAAWDYKIGSFQVLRKWLSYRDKRVLGRDLTTQEARAFTSVARRLTDLVLLGACLDASYIGVTSHHTKRNCSPAPEHMHLGGQAFTQGRPAPGQGPRVTATSSVVPALHAHPNVVSDHEVGELLAVHAS